MGIVNFINEWGNSFGGGVSKQVDLTASDTHQKYIFFFCNLVEIKVKGMIDTGQSMLYYPFYSFSILLERESFSFEIAVKTNNCHHRF